MYDVETTRKNKQLLAAIRFTVEDIRLLMDILTGHHWVITPLHDLCSDVESLLHDIRNRDFKSPRFESVARQIRTLLLGMEIECFGDHDRWISLFRSLGTNLYFLARNSYNVGERYAAQGDSMISLDVSTDSGSSEFGVQGASQSVQKLDLDDKGFPQPSYSAVSNSTLKATESTNTTRSDPKPDGYSYIHDRDIHVSKCHPSMFLRPDNEFAYNSDGSEYHCQADVAPPVTSDVLSEYRCFGPNEIDSLREYYQLLKLTRDDMVDLLPVFDFMDGSMCHEHYELNHFSAYALIVECELDFYDDWCVRRFSHVLKEFLSVVCGGYKEQSEKAPPPSEEMERNDDGSNDDPTHDDYIDILSDIASELDVIDRLTSRKRVRNFHSKVAKVLDRISESIKEYNYLANSHDDDVQQEDYVDEKQADVLEWNSENAVEPTKVVDFKINDDGSTPGMYFINPGPNSGICPSSQDEPRKRSHIVRKYGTSSMNAFGKHDEDVEDAQEESRKKEIHKQGQGFFA